MKDEKDVETAVAAWLCILRTLGFNVALGLRADDCTRIEDTLRIEK